MIVDAFEEKKSNRLWNKTANTKRTQQQKRSKLTNNKMEDVGDWKVEYAKSGRSKCRLTGKNIPNKALRIGEIVEGDYGQYAVW